MKVVHLDGSVNNKPIDGKWYCEAFADEDGASYGCLGQYDEEEDAFFDEDSEIDLNGDYLQEQM